MAYNCRVVCDSISPNRIRLTTLEVTFPRFILSEFNTHRNFCLTGDSIIEFDLPISEKRHRRVHRMRLDEFVDKWLNGAKRFISNPKTNYDLSWIDDNQTYSANEVASYLGMANASNINLGCRKNVINAWKSDDNTWMIKGIDVKNWRNSKPEHTRFNMRDRLSSMRIRQLNEDTGDIQVSNVIDACVSGIKPVYEIRAGEFKIAGSKDHRIFTADGWKPIKDLSLDDYIVVRKFGIKDDEKKDPLRLKKINGKWRSVWQNKKRDEFSSIDKKCRSCKINDASEIHHNIPVFLAPELAFDDKNVTFICSSCHDKAHEHQGWQQDRYLYGALVKIDEIIFRGEEQTYDLSIAGKFENFIANGIVVHNSRNSASSRAIPVEKQLKRIIDDPFVPSYWGKNQKGMQAEQEVSSEEQMIARAKWIEARDNAIVTARSLMEIGIHKQITNRLLEPFMWHTVIVTATDWSNFFALRAHSAAQPEIKIAAEMMRSAIDSSKPIETNLWHLPLVTGVDFDQLVDDWHKNKFANGLELWDAVKLVSAGRCARVSYLTHDGKRDPQADIDLCKRLQIDGHYSPLEHVARPMTEAEEATGLYHSNFKGWVQFRKEIPNEDDYSKIDK